MFIFKLKEQLPRNEQMLIHDWLKKQIASGVLILDDSIELIQADEETTMATEDKKTEDRSTIHAIRSNDGDVIPVIIPEEAEFARDIDRGMRRSRR